MGGKLVEIDVTPTKVETSEATPFTPGSEIVNKAQIGEYCTKLKAVYPDEAKRTKAHDWLKQKFGGRSRTKWTETEMGSAMANLAERGK